MLFKAFLVSLLINFSGGIHKQIIFFLLLFLFLNCKHAFAMHRQNLVGNRVNYVLKLILQTVWNSISASMFFFFVSGLFIYSFCKNTQQNLQLVISK